ncbi:helix-turn-helix domain-containing protein [Cellulomonas sp. ATA003]
MSTVCGRVRADAVRLRAVGSSTAAIARSLGVGRATVSRAARTRRLAAG